MTHSTQDLINDVFVSDVAAFLKEATKDNFNIIIVKQSIGKAVTDTTDNYVLMKYNNSPGEVLASVLYNKKTETLTPIGDKNTSYNEYKGVSFTPIRNVTENSVLKRLQNGPQKRLSNIWQIQLSHNCGNVPDLLSKDSKVHRSILSDITDILTEVYDSRSELGIIRHNPGKPGTTNKDKYAIYDTESGEVFIFIDYNEGAKTLTMRSFGSGSVSSVDARYPPVKNVQPNDVLKTIAAWVNKRFGHELKKPVKPVIDESTGYILLPENAAANSVSGGGVDLTPHEPCGPMQRRNYKQFDIDSATFRKFECGKVKHANWSGYLNLNDACHKEIYDYATTNPSHVVILRDSSTGVLRAIRRTKK